MTRSLLISVAALAVACGGGSHQSDTRETGAPSGAAQPNGSAQAGAAANTTAAQSGGDQGGATQANQTVTLVGCLVGPGERAEPTGTSGTRARARAKGPDTTAAATAGASSDRFMLVDAIVPGADLGGVGANGAGASGGPLVSGKAAFDLDGVPPEARANVNKQVKVVGRLDARPATAGGSSDTAGPAATGGAAGTAGRDAAGASSGNAASGIGSPTASGGASNRSGATAANSMSGSSDAPGAHGTGQKSVAGHGTMGSAARSDLRNQLLVVESVQLVADTCAKR
jgi:hypothetical protein